MEPEESPVPRLSPTTPSLLYREGPGMNFTDIHQYGGGWLSNPAGGNMSYPPSPAESPFAATRVILFTMRKYYTPTIACLGLVLNTVGWTTLLLSRLRKNSFSHYLGAAAVANSIYLGCVMLKWLSIFGLEFYHSPAWCNFVSFADSVSKFYALWFVVAFAVDRYIWFCHPNKTNKMCSPFRAKIVIICLTLLGLVVFMNTSLTVAVMSTGGSVGKKRYRCRVIPTMRHHLEVLSVIDIIVNVFLPYLLIPILLVLIVKKSFPGSCLPPYGCGSGEQPMEEAVWKWEKKILCLRWTMWCRDPLARTAKHQQYTNVMTSAGAGAGGAPGAEAATSSHQPACRSASGFTRHGRTGTPRDLDSRLLTIAFLLFFFITTLPLELVRTAEITNNMFGLGVSHVELNFSEIICQKVFVTSLVLQFWVCFVFYSDVRSVWESVICRCNPRRNPEAEMVAQDDPSAAVSEFCAASGNSQSYV